MKLAVLVAILLITGCAHVTNPDHSVPLREEHYGLNVAPGGR